MRLSSENRFETNLAVCLAVAAAVLRVLPHPPNVTPVAAAAFFAGVVLRGRLAVAVPLAAMALSDLVIGPHALFPFTWGALALAALLGSALRSPGPGLVLGGTLAGSLLFFVVTNFGVFLFGGLYPRTWDGLVECFALALPFFRSSVLGDLAYSALLFGTFALAKAGHRPRTA